MKRKDYLDGKVSHDDYYRALARKHHVKLSARHNKRDAARTPKNTYAKKR